MVKSISVTKCRIGLVRLKHTRSRVLARVRTSFRKYVLAHSATRNLQRHFVLVHRTSVVADMTCKFSMSITRRSSHLYRTEHSPIVHLRFLSTNENPKNRFPDCSIGITLQLGDVMFATNILWHSHPHPSVAILFKACNSSLPSPVVQTLGHTFTKIP